uniref:7TM_GPCR_Srx domain-containing protein n=1 Tax=Strongyloides papillosus TaxID=174720 RepID=A0A0N5BJ36_STREA
LYKIFFSISLSTMPYFENITQSPTVKVFGWLTLLLSIIFMIIQCLNNYALCKNMKLLTQNRIYLFMMILGFIYFFEQLFHFFSGIFCVTKWKPSFKVEIIIGGLLNYLYNLSGVTTMALSINRLMIFFPFNKSKTILIYIFSTILIGAIVLVDTIFLFLCIFYNMYIFYNIEFGTWDYSFHENSPFKTIDNKVLIFVNISSFILFLMVIVKIYLNQSNVTSNRRKNKSIEIYLFIQVCINGVFFLIDEILWEYGTYIWPDSNILYTIVNFVWSITPGKDGIMNIIFLK